MRELTMEGAKYMIADKVKLISGGPVMAISDFKIAIGRRSKSGNKEFAGKYSCTWFDGATLKTDSFNEDLLVPVSD